MNFGRGEFPLLVRGFKGQQPTSAASGAGAFRDSFGLASGRTEQLQVLGLGAPFLPVALRRVSSGQGKLCSHHFSRSQGCWVV